jgi:hypothetical protein
MIKIVIKEVIIPISIEPTFVAIALAQPLIKKFIIINYHLHFLHPQDMFYKLHQLNP